MNKSLMMYDLTCLERDLRFNQRFNQRFNLLLLFMVGVGSLWTIGCTPELDEPAVAWIFHDIPDIANVEVFVDDEFKVDVEPGELSRTFNMSLGEHVISVRNSGSSDVLLEVNLDDLTERGNLFVLRGTGSDVRLLPVTRKLPNPIENAHHLEVVNLADSSLSFDLILSSDEIPILSLPLLMNDPPELSDFIIFPAENNLTISSNYLPRNASDFIKDNFLSEEASLLLIRSVLAEEEDEPKLEFMLLSTSL